MFGLPKKVFHLDTNMNMAIKQIPHVILPSGIIIPQKHSSDGTLETNSKLTGTNSIPLPLNAIPFISHTTSSIDSEQISIIDAIEEKVHYVLGYLVCLRNATAVNDIFIKLKDGIIEKFYDIIGKDSLSGERVGLLSSVPILKGTISTSISLVVSAGGSNTITELNIWGYSL